MKPTTALRFFAAVCVCGCSSVFSGSVSSPYEVGLWQGFRQAAISYTFDDGTSNQLPVAIPIFNEFGYPATLFTVTGWVSDWNALRSAANSGHEIASHTVTHTRLGSLSIDGQTVELRDSKNAIETNTPVQKCLTIAYPNCRGSDAALCSSYYIAGRNCSGAIESSTPADFYEIPAFICGNKGTIKTLADFVAKDNLAASAGGWCVFLLHGIDNDGGFSPLSSTILRQSLEHLDANRSTYWVASFSNVVRYIKERNAVSIAETAVLDTQISISITDDLPDSVYNYPVTVRRPLPAGWTSVNVVQAGRSLSSSIVTINLAGYIMFDATPDAGIVEIVKLSGSAPVAPTAPAGLSAIAGDASVNLDWNDNGETDLAGYNIYRSAAALEPLARISSNIASSMYTDAGVTNNTTYRYAVTALNAAGYESPYSNEVAATPVSAGGGPTTMHVASIAVTWVAAGGQNKKGQATVTVVDNNGTAAANVTISGNFTGSLNESRSGVTDASGTAVIKTNAFTKNSGSLTFCVTGATHASLIYQPDANAETCDAAP